MRLIDADVLKELCGEDIAALIDSVPTVDAVVLSFKPGDDIWAVDEEQGRIYCEEGGIKAVAVCKDGKVLMVNKDGLTFEPGKNGVFLTKEAAEDYVKVQGKAPDWISVKESTIDDNL